MRNRDVLVFFVAFWIGAGACALFFGSTAAYSDGYGDGRAQAHQDIAEYCEYQREQR